MRVMIVSILANLASSIAVVVAVIMGTLQIRQMRKTRALFTSAELVRAMQTPEFTKNVLLVLTLPDGADPSLIRTKSEMETAALALSHVYESLGVLVFHRILDLHLVDDLMGGYARRTWKKLKPYVEDRRSELGVYYGEWMQWLVEKLDEYPSPGKTGGANLTHRDWTP